MNYFTREWSKVSLTGAVHRCLTALAESLRQPDGLTIADDLLSTSLLCRFFWIRSSDMRRKSDWVALWIGSAGWMRELLLSMRR